MSSPAADGGVWLVLTVPIKVSIMRLTRLLSRLHLSNVRDNGAYQHFCPPPPLGWRYKHADYPLPLCTRRLVLRAPVPH